MTKPIVRSDRKITQKQKEFIKRSLKKLLGSSLASDRTLPRSTPKQIHFLKTAIGHYKF